MEQKCQKERNVWNNRSAKKEEKLKYGTTEVPKMRKNKSMEQQKCQKGRKMKIWNNRSAKKKEK